MASELDLCNNALAEIAADPISSIDERSLQARECRRILPIVLAEFLSWTAWDHSIKRVTLAAQANTRNGEWLYSYAVPSDMTEAVAIVPAYDQALSSAPSVGPFPFPAIAGLGRLPFIIEGGALYTNVATASLQYQSSEAQIGKIRPMEARAIELELAARLAMPIKKSRELKGDLIKQAEVAKARAIAESENRSPTMQTSYVSEVEYARSGYGDGG